jgi:hypothetical protein
VPGSQTDAAKGEPFLVKKRISIQQVTEDNNAAVMERRASLSVEALPF